VLQKHDDKVVGFDVSEYQGDIDWFIGIEVSIFNLF